MQLWFVWQQQQQQQRGVDDEGNWLDYKGKFILKEVQH